MSKNNETSGKKLTFWSFLNDYSIEIPVIQRDYAQGRDDKEALRRNFLASLEGALDKAVKNDDGSKNGDLLLDFIYGSTPEGNEKIYHPLDGQQRLTTLWLLHWYIALRANRLNEDCPESSEICGRLGKFTYETRVSSREFCRELCDPEKFKSFDGIKARIAEFIKSQTWFHSSWEQDPTISAMLTMLGGSGEGKNDGIEEVFKGVDFESYWDCLTNDSGCPIKFLHQPLHHFGLSDDLYVKMNARGKPLTSFECFKADLIGYIDEKVKEEKDKDEEVGWEKFVKLNTQLTNDDSDKADVPLEIKLDTAWTDIFWKKNKSGDYRIDDVYFTFLNRFFMNYRIRELNGDEEYYKYFEKDTAIVYSSLDNYKWTIRGGEDKGIEIDLFKELCAVLDNYHDFQEQEEEEKFRDIFKCPWGIPFEFIPYKPVDKTNNREDVVPLGFIPACGNKGESFSNEVKMIQRVVFYAVCKYFNEGKADEKSLRRWMRFVWNLVSVREIVNQKTLEYNDYIKDINRVKDAIEIIYSIKDSHNVYSCLKDLKTENADVKKGNTVLVERLEEEKEKAHKILLDEKRGDAKSWEEVISDAEKYAFFKGDIGFMIRDGKGDKWDWSSFDDKWKNVREYFREKSEDSVSSCVKDKYGRACLLRALISRFEVSDVINLGMRSHPNGREMYNNRPNTWRFLLNNKNICGPIEEILKGNVNVKGIKDIGAMGSDQRVLWALSQTQLLDYIVENYPQLHYRVSGGDEGYEALFNADFRILMNPVNTNKTFEDMLGADEKVKDIDFFKLYRRGHFLFQRIKIRGKTWSPLEILVAGKDDKLEELSIDRYLEDYPEVRKTDSDS